MVSKTDIELCRFCSNDGLYSLNEENQNYCDIIFEWFNIFVSTDVSASSLFCRECAARLDDAHSIRKLVLEAEQRLQAMETQDILIEVPQDTEPVNIKIEPGSLKSESYNKIELVEHDVLENNRARSVTYYKCSYKRMQILEMWLRTSSRDTLVHRARQVVSEATKTLPEHIDPENLRKSIASVCKSISFYWKKVTRNKQVLRGRYGKWLDVTVICELEVKGSERFSDEVFPLKLGAGALIRATRRGRLQSRPVADRRCSGVPGRVLKRRRTE